MNFIFIFISSSDPNLLQKKSVKQKIKKRSPKDNFLCALRHEMAYTSLYFSVSYNFVISMKEHMRNKLYFRYLYVIVVYFNSMVHVTGSMSRVARKPVFGIGE